MYFGRVIGSVVATKKDHKLMGRKLLIVQRVNYLGENDGDPIIAVDFVMAGVGDFVFYTKSKDAAWPLNKDAPVDAGIMGIVDKVSIQAKPSNA